MQSTSYTSVLLLCAGLLAAASASAESVLPLTGTVINTGSPTAESYQVLTTGATPPSISPTVTYTIGDTFNESGSNSTSANFGSSATGPGGPWNFQDDYFFSTTGATIGATSIAFQTDLSDLQARLISASGVSATDGQVLVGGSSVLTILSGWTTYTAGAEDFTVILPGAVAPGNYILQVRGESSTPGSYAGTVTFTPVPLPPSLPLLLLSLAGACWLLGRRPHASLSGGQAPVALAFS
jgi:hypothetical protein